MGEEAALAGKVLAGTVAIAYAVKYGSLAVDFPFAPSVPLSAGILAAPPLLLGARYAQLSAGEGEGGGLPQLSMADVKKYGVAGTIAYVLTELAFWAFAFPVAATLFYNTAGHWPDLGNNVDRATVLGFVFAGANVARLAVPLRFGAALALAPWVDENIVARLGKGEDRA
mmetsp:Transcript_19283/g.47392  ORF Transcript_19283/g.47392 Transcript_19283/m.47392 type:complete len:170 (-) Transcript_19283:183-692(-)